MSTVLNDVAYGLRTLARNRNFSIAAVATLALGIGANTAIFSLVHGVLLRPLPFPDADRIHLVWNQNTREGIDRDVTSYPNLRDWRERTDLWEGLAGYSSGSVPLTGEGDPEQVRAAWVSEDFLTVLGVAPLIGRGFAGEDMQAGSDDVVLIGEGLWQRRYGGDPAIIGRSIQLSSRSYTVIGVLPAAAAHPADVEVWGPLVIEGNLAENRGTLWLAALGRLRAGVRPELAQQRMNDVAAQLAAEYPASNSGSGILLEPLHRGIVGEARTPLLVLLAAVSVVLLIGCVNVANLLLARGAARRRELAVRTALGAGRRRVARQLLTESVVLAVIGAGIGAVLAVWLVGALIGLAPAELPRLDAVRVDATVLGFTALVAIAAGLLFGLAPLWQASRTDLMHALRQDGRVGAAGDGAGRLRPALVSAEVGLALVLLITAGLLIRSFVALSDVEPGFATEEVLTFRVAVPTARYDTGARIREFHGDLLQRLQATPGVTAAGAAATLMLTRLPNMAPITMEGDAPPSPDAPVVSVVMDAATPGYFAVAGMSLVSGREFTTADAADAPLVVVVNETFVRTFLPDTEPVGRRFTFGIPTQADVPWLEIVGVIADTRRSGLDVPVRPEAYAPHAQSTVNGLTYVLRTRGEPLSLVPAVRAAVRELDPLLPVTSVATVEDRLAESLAARRFIMMLLAGFAAVASLLAATGIYGVVSYLVAQRTRELGVRVALGASRTDVLRMVMTESLRQVLPGVVIGAGAAVALSTLLRSQLFGVPAHDPFTFAAVITGIVALSLAASLVPAARAARLDPVTALRQD